MNRVIFPIPMLLAGAIATAQEPETATSRWFRVESALTLLEQRHVIIAPRDLEAGMLTGLVTAADPSGRVIARTDLAAFEKSSSGMTANAGWKLSSTNHLVVMQEAIDSSRNPAIPAGWAVTSLEGRSTETNAWASVVRRLRRSTEGSLQVGLTDPIKGVSTNILLQLSHSLESPVCGRDVWLGDILYVRLNGIHPRSGPELQAALKPDPALRGLILDLRDAGGEDVDSVLAASALFCGPDKVLAQWKGLDDSGASDLRSAPWVGPVIETPVLVLINGQTRGASELFAALIARCGRGVLLLGEPTTGDPLIRESIPLENGPVLHVATRKLVFAEGLALDSLKLLLPDVRVEDHDLDEAVSSDGRPWFSQNHLRSSDTAAQAAGDLLQNRIRHDAILKRAVDIMLGLRALPTKTR